MAYNFDNKKLRKILVAVGEENDIFPILVNSSDNVITTKVADYKNISLYEGYCDIPLSGDRIMLHYKRNNFIHCFSWGFTERDPIKETFGDGLILPNSTCYAISSKDRGLFMISCYVVDK